MASYVDFDAIKATVTFQHIFAHYGIAVVRERGSELTVHCPFHNDTRPSLKANVARGVFNCFGGCGAKGDIIGFVARKEGMVGGDRNQDRVAAARLIVRWFGMTQDDDVAPDKEAAPMPSERMAIAEDTAREAEDDAVADTLASNPVLTFRLKLEPHPYLAERELTPATIEHFGLGYCNRGLMKGRIAIPIANPEGLVGYAGRWVGEPPLGTPKYLLPPTFHKSLELFNLHAVPAAAQHIVLVEGYWSVFWLWQELGMENVVAAMGCMLSERQQTLLCERFASVTIVFDGDQAGREASMKVTADLVRHMWVRVVACPEGLQPDQIPAPDLRALLHRASCLRLS